MRKAVNGTIHHGIQGGFDSARELFFVVAPNRDDPDAAMCRFLLWVSVRIVASWDSPEVTTSGALEENGRPLNVLVAEILVHTDKKVRERMTTAIRHVGGDLMRLLSIDLPWSSANGRFGFAWLETGLRSLKVTTFVVDNAAANAMQTFVDFEKRHGRFDAVLIDQPIDSPNGSTGYREVERAFGNSSFVANGPIRIQAPRFQPGAAHASRGLANAEAASLVLGTPSCIVVESFPQLSIPPLIAFSTALNLPIQAVTRLKQHKVRGVGASAAGQQLVAAFSTWTNTTVTGAASNGEPDAIDALLALLPLLEVVAPSGRGTALPVWLHAVAPGAPHPSTVRQRMKSGARAKWMSPLQTYRVGSAGVRSDGLLALTLPGWADAAGPVRVL